jgi:alpha-tubulin suppressor-like RCC1 family protein
VACPLTTVCCGGSHSLGLDETGGVWSWGWGGSGALGHGSQRREGSPRRIMKGLPGSVALIGAGFQHSVAVTQKEGSLFAWGCGAQGQLGLGTQWSATRGNECVPCPVRSVHSRVTAVSCGLELTAAVTEEGALVVMGQGTCGQLGLGDLTRTRMPHPVTVRDALFAGVSCGSDLTIGLTTEGEVYHWGQPSAVPVRVTALPSIASVHAGALHAAAVGQDGYVDGWV